MMMIVRFESVSVADKDLLTEFSVQSHDIYGTRKADFEFTKQLFEVSDRSIEHQTVEVLKSTDDLVGFYCIDIQESGAVELTHLFVKSGLQRKGYGTILFNRCIEMAKRKGRSQKLSWISDPDSVGFYNKFGASVMGTEINLLNPGVPVVLFELDLVEEHTQILTNACK